jgi:hypothetical protein
MHLEVGESVELDLDAEGVLDAGRGDEEPGHEGQVFSSSSQASTPSTRAEAV